MPLEIMGYLRFISKKALEEAWQLVVGQPYVSVAIALIVWAIPLLVGVLRNGGLSVNAAIQQGLVGLFPLSVVFLCVYLAHMLFFSPKRDWEENQKYKTGPVFGIKCGNEHSVCSVPHLGAPLHYFRAIVTSNRRYDLTGCHGKLLSIRFNGCPLRDHHTDTLPFEYSADPDSISKTIKHGVPYNLDVLRVQLHIPENQIVHICKKDDQIMPAMTKDGQIVFHQPGEYTLQLAVIGDIEPATPCTLYFYWTGRANDSELTSTRRANHPKAPSAKLLQSPNENHVMPLRPQQMG